MTDNIQYKYPTTLHLPWSPGVSRNDKVLKDTQHFENRYVVVTEKMDGENTTLAYNKIHARSLDSRDHKSRHWVKANFSYMVRVINPLYRICGENVFAEHSIAYKNLDSYFYAFSVWRKDVCFNWKTTEKYLNRLHLIHTPVIYKGLWNEKLIRAIVVDKTEKGEMEGYVVRVAESFTMDNFSTSVAKYVRKNHIQTDEHWMHKEVIPNKLK